jgi:Cu+-exporting ATPase
MLYDFLPEMKSVAITDFEEITGKGIRARFRIEVIIGSAAFAGNQTRILCCKRRFILN